MICNIDETMSIRGTSKPFIKWAGGKSQLLTQLDAYLPKRLYAEEFTYVEPFVGGGAMLFHMLQKFSNIKNVVINDVNENLVKAYKTIKDNPQPLINDLTLLEKKYISLNSEERKKMYLDVRQLFNDHNSDDVKNTAYLIFLNKTCFNGLYRVNSRDEFNVPHGRYKNPVICNPDVIKADNEIMNCHPFSISCGDFSAVAHVLDNSAFSFVYLDPPYRPLSSTSSFTSYAKGNFGDDDQKRLAAFCEQMDADNCLWMLSNSDCSAENPSDLFLENLYKNFRIERVVASRSINSNPDKRGKLTELLVYNNYEII